MKLIVGLGNPGRTYAATRHNVGWWGVDFLAGAWGFSEWKKDGQSLSSTGRVADTAVKLLKPQTFMNLSGNALVQYARRPTWQASTDLLVIVDEVALPLGTMRLRGSGSAGGHNGLKSIEAALGHREYPRLRIGVRPEGDDGAIGDLADFVLAPFSKREATIINAVLARMRDGVEIWLRDGIEPAMRVVNNRRREDE